MALLRFRVKANVQKLAIDELKRGIPEEVALVDVKPSKSHEQDVIVTISTPAENWSSVAWATINTQARNRAIHLLKGGN